MTLSFLAGPNVLLPPSPGRDRSLSAAGLAPAQAAAAQPTYSKVITYSVQRGDTLFAVAKKFGLTPHTVYWSNPETLARNPDRLNVGTVLNILPVNGVYHVVSEGETIADLAQKYDVEPAALDNVWNDLTEGQSLTAGAALVIPGGNGGSAPWPLEETSIGGNSSSNDSSGAALCGAELSGEPGRRRFDWPTDERKISGWYFHDTRNPAHAGIDIDLNTGDPVRAADGGIISFGGWWVHGGYGNLVVVNHLNGWETWYAHLSKVKVVCGQQVRAGDIIGLGGSTGWSTGPHLHFEMRLAEMPQNPLAYLP
jgi:murein DD-endopeptidase MepM/ murein hydrolase activator NlpD